VKATHDLEIDDTRPPDLLTVEQAAAVLHIGRSSSYSLVREYLATNGASGLPAIRLGALIRVPRPLLEQMLGGPITWPPTQRTRAVESAAPPAARPSTTPNRSRRAQQPLPEQTSLSLQA
jgi:hypothetical protein